MIKRYINSSVYLTIILFTQLFFIFVVIASAMSYSVFDWDIKLP